MLKLSLGPDGLLVDKEYIAKRNLGDSATKKKIEAEVIRLTTEWDSQEYARNRASQFPELKEQFDMQYWDQVNGTTTWQDVIAKVKSDNPKK